MNLKMITLKLAVTAMSAAMLLSQCMTDPEGTGSYRGIMEDTGQVVNEIPADGTEVADTVYTMPAQH